MSFRYQKIVSFKNQNIDIRDLSINKLEKKINFFVKEELFEILTWFNKLIELTNILNSKDNIKKIKDLIAFDCKNLNNFYFLLKDKNFKQSFLEKTKNIKLVSFNVYPETLLNKTDNIFNILQKTRKEIYKNIVIEILENGTKKASIELFRNEQIISFFNKNGFIIALDDISNNCSVNNNIDFVKKLIGNNTIRKEISIFKIDASCVEEIISNKLQIEDFLDYVENRLNESEYKIFVFEGINDISTFYILHKLSKKYKKIKFLYQGFLFHKTEPIYL